MSTQISDDKVFVLVAVKGTTHQPQKEGSIALIQGHKTTLLSSGNWRGWDLQVRTKAGYAKVPILIKRPAGTKKVRVSSRKKEPTWSPYKD